MESRDQMASMQISVPVNFSKINHVTWTHSTSSEPIRWAEYTYVAEALWKVADTLQEWADWACWSRHRRWPDDLRVLCTAFRWSTSPIAPRRNCNGAHVHYDPTAPSSFEPDQSVVVDFCTRGKRAIDRPKFFSTFFTWKLQCDFI